LPAFSGTRSLQVDEISRKVSVLSSIVKPEAAEE
jgi:hypothetical protein